MSYLVIVQRLDHAAESPFTPQQIEVAAKCGACYQRWRGRCHGLHWPRERFVLVLTQWLGFLGRLQICEPVTSKGAELIEQFAAHMWDERRRSVRTIRSSRWHTEKFFSTLAARELTLAEVTITDVDSSGGSGCSDGILSSMSG